jgi:hypothetical protein
MDPWGDTVTRSPASDSIMPWKESSRKGGFCAHQPTLDPTHQAACGRCWRRKARSVMEPRSKVYPRQRKTIPHRYM